MLISKLKQWVVSFIIMQATPTGLYGAFWKAYKSTQCTKVQRDLHLQTSRNLRVMLFIDRYLGFQMQPCC